MDEDDELARFRRLWIEEVKQTNRNSVEDRAMSFFQQGIEHEKRSHFEDAITAYRSALKLDPDIEKKYVVPVDIIENEEPILHSSEVTEVQPIKEEKKLKNQKSNWLNQPTEIIILILQQLAMVDLHGFFNLAQTCSMLLALIRHESIWSYICDNLLVKSLCHPEAFLNISSEISWFTRFKEIPHLRSDGCYISRIEYKRPGLSCTSLRLANLATVHLVTYYRYLRFLSGNKALILITHKEPKDIVKKIYLGSKLEGLLLADVIWKEPNIILLQWLGKNQKNITQFLAQLLLTSSVPGQHNKLRWRNFFSLSEEGEWIPFPKDQLKSFIFSRVRSY